MQAICSRHENEYDPDTENKERTKTNDRNGTTDAKWCTVTGDRNGGQQACLGTKAMSKTVTGG